MRARASPLVLRFDPASPSGRWRSRPLFAGLTLALVLLGSASPSPAQRLNPELWSTNGPVWAVAVAGQTIYIGGAFTYVGPATGGGVPLSASGGDPLPDLPRIRNGISGGTVSAIADDGLGGWFIGGSFDSVGGFPRRNLAHVRADLSVSPWDPGPDGSVYALAVSGGTVYAGGSFARIGLLGQARAGIAALDTALGVISGWDPSSNGIVTALALGGGKVYAAGNFGFIGGQAHFGVAALDSATGQATDWNPSPDGDVLTLAVSGGKVYVGGRFTSIGGQPRFAIAALDNVTGQATAWNPGATRDFTLAPVRTLAVSGATVYAGGDFTNIGGQPRSHIAALDSATGQATAWHPDADGDVLALAVSDGTVYAGGGFTFIGGRSRHFLAALDTFTGEATAWNPNPSDFVSALAIGGTAVYAGGSFEFIGGQSRSRIAALDMTTGHATSWNPGADGDVNVLAVSGGTVYAAGRFSGIGGLSRNGFAALDSITGLATSWDPAANDRVSALAVSGGTVYAGGRFTSIGGMPRDYIAALDAASGQATAWNPGANAPPFGDVVSALAVSGGTVYAGGGFTFIGGQLRASIAALDSVTGQATTWNPFADFPVFALAVSGGTVYAGGSFNEIGGRARNRIAALDRVTGLATTWDPGADSFVDALAVSGGTVYAGGSFDSIGGQARNGIAALDSATGQPTAWNPGAPNTACLGLSVGTLYAGGQFTIGDEHYLAAFRGDPVARLRSVSPSLTNTLTVTVGDTATGVFTLQNIGLGTLTVSGVEADSPGMSFTPSPPFRVPPGVEQPVTVLYQPREPAARASADIRIAGDDPYTPLVDVPISIEALSLTVQTRALIVGDRAPLGQAITIQVIPDAGRRIERGILFFRSDHAAPYDSVALSASATTFIGIIPGSAVREGGIEYYVRLENHGVFATAPPAAPDSVFSQPVATPTSVTTTALEAPAGGHPVAVPLELVIALPLGAQFREGRAFFRTGGAAAYDSLDLVVEEIVPGLNEPVARVSADSVGARGIEYWVRVETATAVLTDPAVDPSAHPRIVRTDVDALAEPSAHAGGRYRLVTIPLELNLPAISSLEAILSDQREFGPYDPLRWRSFRWIPATSAYVEIGAGASATGALRPEPGRAFWLIAREANRIDTAPVAGRSTIAAPITLEPGWNQVGNPYDFAVAWDSISASDAAGSVALEPPVAWDETAGRYQTTDVAVLEPFVGYWMHNPRPGPVQLQIPSLEAPPGPATARVAAASGAPADSLAWTVQIEARCGAASDTRNMAGVSLRARAGQDALDRTEPPMAPGETLSLYFVGPEPGKRRAVDERPLLAPTTGDPTTRGELWVFDVARGGEDVRASEVSLTFAGVGRVPDDVALRLVDRTLDRVIDLRHESAYRYVMGARGYDARAADARFALVAGSPTYVEAAGSGLAAAPTRTTLEPPSPNPLTSASVLRFEVERAGKLTLEAFDFAGRRVRTLADGRREAGRYELAWSGDDSAGQRLRPGVYWLRLSGAGRTEVRKVVLMR